MAAASKSFMFSARVPRDLIERVDFVVRNSEPDTIPSRSAAVQMALEDWLAGPEHDVRKRLGTAAPKTKSA